MAPASRRARTCGGYRRGSDRREAGENAFGPVKGYRAFGLNRGASYEIIDRQNAYGWLVGARFVEPENWYHYHMQPAAGGRRVPFRAAKDFQPLYDLSKREDRGLVYAPLALLMPIHQHVSGSGAQMYATGYRQSAALATLVPSCPVPDFRRQGIEGGFCNSEFGEIFDVVSADATNDAERTFAAIRPYKAAALIGEFRADGMVPYGWTRRPGIPNSREHTVAFQRIYRGEVTFEILRAVFRRVQEETMPFAVAGDIHRGVNKVEKLKGGKVERSWVVWMFNNKGITNYIDEAPVIDPGSDAKVTVKGINGVTVKAVREIRANAPVGVSDGCFTVTVPAGGWTAYAIDAE